MLQEEVAKVARTATEYELCPHNATEQNLIRTADDAAQRLEDVARKIERLLTDNKVEIRDAQSGCLLTFGRLAGRGRRLQKQSYFNTLARKKWGGGEDVE